VKTATPLRLGSKARWRKSFWPLSTTSTRLSTGGRWPRCRNRRYNATTAPSKPYREIKACSAVFLKSGDIQIHTTFAAQTRILFDHVEEWVHFVGNQAKAIIPIHRVIITVTRYSHSTPTAPKQWLPSCGLLTPLLSRTTKSLIWILHHLSLQQGASPSKVA
jgi:uncharacterized protein (UPF0248 family)